MSLSWSTNLVMAWSLGFLALLSWVVTLWQWWVARRFPLHRRDSSTFPFPAVTLLKPLKGCEPATEDCLRSWFAQEYGAEVQILFGVGDSADSVCPVVLNLIKEFPGIDAKLLICDPTLGANAKVSKLIQLEAQAKHSIVIISDADVRVPPDLLTQLVRPLKEPRVGLVNCFYSLANPTTAAMHWEAVSMNADFWSQVLQSQSMKPIDFALGAVMATRRDEIEQMGGFRVLADCLADDYQLGNRIASAGRLIALCPVVVECWAPPTGWREVWKHQLRWARTIRVCQPVPYFFSLLGNATLWPLLFLVCHPTRVSLVMAAICTFSRGVLAADLQRRLTRIPAPVFRWFMAPVKDLLQVAIWLGAFLGNHIEWRGVRMGLRSDGTLIKC